MPKYRYTDEVRTLVRAGHLTPKLGYHGTALTPTIKVGGYVLPWNQLQEQHVPTGRHEATYATYSDLNRAYYTPIKVGPGRCFYTGDTAWDSAWCGPAASAASRLVSCSSSPRGSSTSTSISTTEQPAATGQPS